jgi:BlaI family transcriptional regulator, penicillinase repressor
MFGYPNLENQILISAIIARKQSIMNRPAAELLTERELEVMHAFWRHGEMNAQQARDHLESEGRVLTYTTVATLCRILWEKKFLNRIGESRPYVFQSVRSFDDVSGGLVSELISKVFRGSREQLLMQVFSSEKLTQRKRELLEELLRDEHSNQGEVLS